MRNSHRFNNQPVRSHDKNTREDEKWMEKALITAKDAAAKGEVPIGAVLINDNGLICAGGNSPIGSNDPTAHAEIVVIRGAATILKNYRLPGTTLYVTLEPCIMCVGAMLHARINRLVYGAPDPKSGAVSSLYNIGSDGLLNHTLEITGPVLQNKCAALLKNFFAEKRKTANHCRDENI